VNVNKHEIVELLRALGIHRKEVGTIAKTLLKAFDSVMGIFNANITDFGQLKGVGEATAVALMIIQSAHNLFSREQLEDGPLCNSVEKESTLWKYALEPKN
jgi:DNA repair protein RadC